MRDDARDWLEANYQKNFCPKPEVEIVQNIFHAPPSRKLASDLFHEDDDELALTHSAAEVVSSPAQLEVKQYLEIPQIKGGMMFDLLGWWKSCKGKFPNLSKMARQYLALPATSGVVERLFSKSGLMHGDLRKSTKEETLELLLKVAKNS
jgi:hypothetical protein